MSKIGPAVLRRRVRTIGVSLPSLASVKTELGQGEEERVISAFEELQHLGHLGEECLVLVERLLREELRRFLPLGSLEFE